jgi:FAD/FMN-containing dehydrogenase
MSTLEPHAQRGANVSTIVLGSLDVESLRGALRGEALQPGDEGYEVARHIYNGMIDRHPRLIVRCAGVADVMATVNFAREHGLGVSVKGGGHGVAGNSLCDDGVVIDLALMRSVRVDPVRRTVRAEGGCRWRDVDHETQAFGLATTGGTISDTGIGGLTLGGGIGWLARKHGLSCDNLLSVDLVTADGRFLTASATENQDLFWAVRGGGLAGVVTSFEYQLHPVSTILGGLILYPVDQAAELLRFHREFSATAPDELTTIVMFVTAPPAPFVPEHLHGAPMVAVVGAYCGALEEGERVVAPLKQFGPPALDLFGPMPYGALQTMLDEAAPIGIPNYWKSETLRELSDGMIETLVARNASRPAPFSMIHVIPLSGAPSRVGGDETAFAHREPSYIIHVIGIWQDPAQNAQHIAWVRDTWSAIQPASIGTYLNFTNDDDAGKLRSAYGANYERLAAIKRQYDPTGLFVVNRAITRGS